MPLAGNGMEPRSRRCAILAGCLLFAMGAAAGWCHFQALLPSADVVSAEGARSVDLKMLFTHPMEQGPVMEMGQPRRFGVLAQGAEKDLLGSLVRRQIDGESAYSASYKFTAPGDHVFFLEPAPYWEPAERKMIVHYTKVVVNAFGQEVGWDTLVGFPVEIEPLTRPYGVWTGNAFRGVVRREGKPVPFAQVEIEYWNEGRHVRIPSDPFVTQTIKADGQGVFSYSLPRAGWWGFAALVEGREKMRNPDGKEVEVELGGLMWVRCLDME